MKNVKCLLLLLLTVAIVVAYAFEISAEPATTVKPKVTIRQVESQVVLYTIYRGSYEHVGMAIGKLFAKAGENNIVPRGPVTLAYLNNPTYVASEHWLTEVRFPVDKDALKLAGTLGEMTDVKTLKAKQVAVSIKPESMVDPEPLYDNLFAWIMKHGYLPIEGPSEIFLSNAMTSDYAQMKTEIMIPIAKPD